MSFPTLANRENFLSKEDALAAVIASIAAEEDALASIMEAESEKIRFAKENARLGKREDMQMLLCINESVNNVIDSIMDMQIILKNKLRLALGHLPRPPIPPCPCPRPCPNPPHPPDPPHCKRCVAVFLADNRFLWSAGRTLILREDPCRHHENTCCIKVQRRQGDTFIVLPAGMDFTADIDFELRNPRRTPVTIELIHQVGNMPPDVKLYTFDSGESRIELRDTVRLQQHGHGQRQGQLSFRLASDTGLAFRHATVKLTEARRRI